MLGSRKDGPPELDLESQVRFTFVNLNAILAETGCSFDDVVDPNSKFETIGDVAVEYWCEAHYLTVTAIGVTWLSGFDFRSKVIAMLRD